MVNVPRNLVEILQSLEKSTPTTVKKYESDTPIIKDANIT